MGEYEHMEKKNADPNSTLRVVAFLSVVFSTVAVTSCLLAFPLVFNYIQALQANVQSEVEFCKARSRDMWKEMLDIHHVGSVTHSEGPETPFSAFTQARKARQAVSIGTCKLILTDSFTTFHKRNSP